MWDGISDRIIGPAGVDEDDALLLVESVRAMTARTIVAVGLFKAMRHTRRDVNEVARLHLHHKVEVRAVAHFRRSFEHQNRRFVRLVIVGLSTDAGGNLEQMHTDRLRACGLRRDASEVVESLLTVKSRASTYQLAVRQRQSYDL